MTSSAGIKAYCADAFCNEPVSATILIANFFRPEGASPNILLEVCKYHLALLDVSYYDSFSHSVLNPGQVVDISTTPPSVRLRSEDEGGFGNGIVYQPDPHLDLAQTFKTIAAELNPDPPPSDERAVYLCPMCLRGHRPGDPLPWHMMGCTSTMDGVPVQLGDQ
jgi:hypothetical protein